MMRRCEFIRTVKVFFANEFAPTCKFLTIATGQTAVISLARTTSDLHAIVDADYACRCARALGVKTLGTCGVILLAKRRGFIPSVKPALDALRSAGLWLSDSLIRTILIEAGEI